MPTRADVERIGALAERLIALGEVTTSVAHETRSALQRAQTALDEIERVADGALALNAPLVRLQDALDELTRLQDGVRRFAAPIDLSLESCDLAELAKLAWDDLKTMRAGRDAALEIAGAPAWCRADAYAMRQVFRNLLQNAVSIAPDPVRVDVGFAPEQAERPHVRVRVVDNGPGVSPEALERVFEPFWTQRPGGSGLGLALARRLARAHGGELWARPGPGGVFELRLPCVQAVAATADGGPEGGESSPPSGSEGVATAS